MAPIEDCEMLDTPTSSLSVAPSVGSTSSTPYPTAKWSLLALKPRLSTIDPLFIGTIIKWRVYKFEVEPLTATKNGRQSWIWAEGCQIRQLGVSRKNRID
jgi:hypothetical protein